MNKNQMETIVRWKELESQLIEAIKRKDEENETRIRKQMKWILENKFNKIESIQYETENAILTDGVWVPNNQIIDYQNSRFYPKWIAEKKGGKNE